MPKVAIIVIGDEILLGRVADTNSAFLERQLEPLSWPVVHVETVPDDFEAIVDAIMRGRETADIILTTGGLGPTRDDITKQALCECYGGGLMFNPEVYANVKEVMARRGRKMNALTLSQAMVPEECKVIQNRVGTAPLMWFERDGVVLVAMPGVPFETEQMFVEEVLPRLQERFGVKQSIEHRYLLVADLSESAIAEQLRPIEDALPEGLHLAYLPSQGYVKLRLDGTGCPDSDAWADLIAGILGEHVIGREDLSLAALLLKRLEARVLTVATAESCTGGNIAHEITLVPGSSAAMQGGVVSYTNEVKVNVLGVKCEVLSEFGAVSIPVVEQMAEGARRVCRADVAVATSGIAGPTGGTPEKPVGTVCIAAVGPQGMRSDTYHFAGNRQRVINHATNIALINALRTL